jgi:anti-sigma B factor antagonist
MDYKTVLVSERHGYKIVEIMEKRIYLTVTEIFKEELISIVDEGNLKLIVDLNRVNVMNSVGLGVLILARDTLNKRGGVIKLTNLQPLLADIFSRMKLDTLFKIYNSNEEAMAGD